MNQPQPTPEDRIMHLEAQVQELDAMAAFQAQRTAALNVEVRLRDRQIAELEAELAQFRPGEQDGTG